MGRIILKPLTGKGFSSAMGKFMESGLSKVLIKLFINKHNIDVTEYVMDDIYSFNDFFTRKIKEGKRPIAETEFLIAPCDGKLTVYTIDNHLVIPVKQSRFSVKRLLMDDELAEKFNGGICLVFRLTVDDYHRYVYVDSGIKEENVNIQGLYHTVRPVALEKIPVFTENTREYTLIHSAEHGDIIQMEVGAMLVGKIDNYVKHKSEMSRGEEKGKFMFGGSTIIVLLEKNRVEINTDITKASAEGKETPVKLGASIGSWR